MVIRSLDDLTPQALDVLKLLEAKGSTTGVEAEAVLRVRHLPRRILDLKEAGFVIMSEWCRDISGQRYMKYHFMGHKDDYAIDHSEAVAA